MKTTATVAEALNQQLDRIQKTTSVEVLENHSLPRLYQYIQSNSHLREQFQDRVNYFSNPTFIEEVRIMEQSLIDLAMGMAQLARRKKWWEKVIPFSDHKIRRFKFLYNHYLLFNPLKSSEFDHPKLNKLIQLDELLTRLTEQSEYYRLPKDIYPDPVHGRKCINKIIFQYQTIGTIAELIANSVECIEDRRTLSSPLEDFLHKLVRLRFLLHEQPVIEGVYEAYQLERLSQLHLLQQGLSPIVSITGMNMAMEEYKDEQLLRRICETLIESMTSGLEEEVVPPVNIELDPILVNGKLEFDLQNSMVRWDGKSWGKMVKYSPEYFFLKLLMLNLDTHYSHDQIGQYIVSSRDEVGKINYETSHTFKNISNIKYNVKNSLLAVGVPKSQSKSYIYARKGYKMISH